jgi:hypothetical protein
MSPEFFIRLSVDLPLVDIDDDEASVEKPWWRVTFADTDVDPRLRDQAMRPARRRAR